jgi:ABC-type antimicrobial peptide transport system permease subunit
LILSGVLAGAIALSRVMASLLFGLVRLDPASLATTILVLASAALLAAWIPVRRAARVDPVVVLREE